MNLRQMTANFKICFTGKHSTKFIEKWLLNIPLHLN